MSRCSILLLATALDLAFAHGGMTTPLPRNSFGKPIHPQGKQALPPFYSNYYDDGCLVGCDSCRHHGADITNTTMNPWGPPLNVGCTVNGKPVGPGVYNISLPGADTLPDYARTWNRFGDKINANPLIGDWQKFQPWRAPGAAVIQDPCGLLCDHCTDPDDPSRPHLFNGSSLPPLPTPPTKWKAGGIAEAGWALMVNHGGGYQYRLCKKGNEMSESCFQAGALAFADNRTTIRYADGSAPEFTIPAVDVTTGVVPKGSTWRRDPIPACACDGGLACHYNGTSGRGQSLKWLESFHIPYSNKTDGPPGCVYGTMFEPAWPQGYGHIAERPDVVPPYGKQPKFNYEMVDQLKVPEEKGEYVLSWRWDTEQKSQVWSSCADVVIE